MSLASAHTHNAKCLEWARLDGPLHLLKAGLPVAQVTNQLRCQAMEQLLLARRAGCRLADAVRSLGTFLCRSSVARRTSNPIRTVIRVPRTLRTTSPLTVLKPLRSNGDEHISIARA